MKSKKLIGAIAAIVMSASFTAGLAACSGGHTHSWTYKDLGGGVHRQECSCGEVKEAPHTNENGDTVCDDCGADLTPSKPIVMTAEKWTQALTFGNNVSLEQTYRAGGAEQFAVAKVDGDKYYLHYREGEYEQESYMETVDGKNYLYSKGYEYWTKKQVDSDDYGFEETREVLDEFRYWLPFDKFEAGSANGEYVTKEAYKVTFTIGEQEPRTVEIKEAKLQFNADGKVVSMEHVSIVEDVEQSISTVFGYDEKLTMPAVLEGEQVTAAEWAAAVAMTDTNYRMGVTTYGLLYLEFLQSGTDKRISAMGWSPDGYAMQEMYYTKQDGKFYWYKSAHGHWTKSEVTDMTDEVYATVSGFGCLEVDLGAYPFTAFTYDADAKTYTYADDEGTVVAMFRNKKLVWANMTSEYGSYTIDLVYGDAQVTLPTVAAGEQVTDEEWDAAKAMDFDNIDAYVEISSSLTSGEVIFKKVGDTMYQQQTAAGTTSEIYADKEGDKYYRYQVVDGVWAKTEIEKSSYDQCGIGPLFVDLDKSDFEWDEATGTYRTDDDSFVIKFVDKKIEFYSFDVGALKQNMYFSYGNATLTLPEEGSPATGGGVIVGPPSVTPTEKDITEEEWQNIFAEAEEAKVLSVDKHTDDDTVEYIFNEPEGYVYVSTDSGETRFVYAVEDGAVVRYDYDEDEEKVTKSATDYATLAEIKEEVLQEAFTDKRLGSVKELYDNFYGTDGSYDYDLDDGYIAVNLDEGQLYYIVYRDGDSSTSYAFYFKAWDAPYWYDEYVMPRVTKAEWDKAFEMDYDSFTVDVSKENGDNVRYRKDGDNYHIYEYKADTETREEHYYYADGGKYYRYDEQADEELNVTYWAKTEITEAEFIQATQMPSLGEHDYNDFTLDEEDYFKRYKNGDETYIIEFKYKKLNEIACEEYVISFSYDDELDMPQDDMTEEEWNAAIAATFNSANFTCEAVIFAGAAREDYVAFVDMDKGVIYKKSPIANKDELHIVKEETLYLYRYTAQNGYSGSPVQYSLQKVFNVTMAGISTPGIFNGQTLSENYSNFRHEGFGEYSYIVDENTHIKVWFKNGKIVSVYANYFLTEDMTKTEIYNFGDYGTTDVEHELPDWYLKLVNKDEK